MELCLQDEALDDEIEKAEQRIRDCRKILAKNAKLGTKLRAKRDQVSLAAYNISRLDQP